jgi:hypothetical protein
MRSLSLRALSGALLLAGLPLVGCDDQAHAPLAPTASASALAASAPKSVAGKPYSLDTKGSTLGFTMDAPDEKIRGAVAASGTLHIDLSDLTQTTGNVVADLGTLELFRRPKAEPPPEPAEGDDKKKDKKKDKEAQPEEPPPPSDGYAVEKMEALQNEHARAWLEIDSSTPEQDRSRNARAEFAIRSIDEVSAKDVTKLSGAERVVTVKATGDFLLHQRLSKKTVELELVFGFVGDQPTTLRIRSKAPLSVGLAEHDVRPRDAFGKLAQRSLEQMGGKVAREAVVSLDLSVTLGEAPAAAAPAAAPAPTADASAAPAADASAAPAADASAAPAADSQAPAATP